MHWKSISEQWQVLVLSDDPFHISLFLRRQTNVGYPILQYIQLLDMQPLLVFDCSSAWMRINPKLLKQTLCSPASR